MFWAARPRSHITDSGSPAAGSGVTSAIATAPVGKVTRERTHFRQGLQSRALPDDDEVPALEVLRRARPAPGVEDGPQVVIGKRLVAEAAYGALRPDRALDVHPVSPLDLHDGESRLPRWPRSRS